MDWTAIGGITASITAARDIAKGIAALRDSALLNEKTSALMEQLLKAQEGLFAHNTALLQLQSDLSEAQQKVRELQARVEDSESYTLFDFGKGSFALRYTPRENPSGASAPGLGQPPHYICQPCFATGRKSVLQRGWIMGVDNGLICPVCKAQVFD